RLSEMEKFTFFWRSNSPFSQWYPASFTVGGITYNCAEQYMMHKKAVLFKDRQTADKVLSTTQPSGQKKLGRQVRNFNEETWMQHRLDIVKAANTAKFTQNSELKKQLFATTGTTLVEASPNDQIWGIGLSAENEEAWSRETWRGMNLLGQALTEVRDEIMKNAEVDAAKSDDDTKKTSKNQGEDKEE
ncbi:riboflavin biosynthesis protein VVA0006-like, partial [Corticium candelabrum]|uniref:riboflavin biosynthesis protein VVA0006-like n=1 Tax=Corticium candelabrum TaxID=121492 RepID=UPI002E2635D3